MAEDKGMSRRKAIGIGAATLASTTLTKLMGGPAEAAASASAFGPAGGIGYFARFGVTDRLIREALGDALARGGDLARAEGWLRQYLELEPEPGSPSHAHAHWRLAQVFEKQERKSDAVAALEAALRLNPDLEEAKKDLKRLRG